MDFDQETISEVEQIWQGSTKAIVLFWLLILDAEDLTRFSTSQFASPRRGTGTFYHARCVLTLSCTNQTLKLYKSDNNDAICFRFQRQSRPRVLAKVGRAGLLAAQVDILYRVSQKKWLIEKNHNPTLSTVRQNFTMNMIWEDLIRLRLCKKRPKNQFPDTSGAAPTAFWKCVFGTPCIHM